MRPLGSYRRRGSGYVAVMGVAMVVTVIGLSALMAVRIQRRSLSGAEAAVKADLLAASLLEVALLRINQTPDWRTTYLHDKWTPDETIDDVTYTFRFVDDQDGDLANDPAQPVRLYVQATAGEAVRIYSALLLSDEAGGASANMLANASVEDGLTGWSAMRCDIQVSTSNPHCGAACLEMTNGEASGSGPQQYVGVVENGVTYDLEVWARKASGTSYVRIAFAITSSGEGKVFFEDPEQDTLVGTAWTKCTATLTPTWTGTLEEVRVKYTLPSGTYDVVIDDAAMRIADGDPTPEVAVVPGTWRRDVLP